MSSNLPWTATVILSVMIGIGAVAAIAVPSFESEDNLIPIVAPVKPTRISESTVEEFEKLGAVYGGFSDLQPMKDFRGGYGAPEWVAHQGRYTYFKKWDDRSKQGLPGFQMKLAAKAKDVPIVDVPFGLELECEDSEVIVPFIKKLIDQPNLETLALFKTETTDQVMRELGKLKQLRRLRVVDQSDRGFTPAGIEALMESMKKLTHLELEFDGTRFSDKVLLSIASNPNLTHLSLVGKGASDDGIRSIGDLTRLNHLHLSMDGATNASPIAALKELKTLVLGPSFNSIPSGSGLKQLETLVMYSQNPRIDTPLPQLERLFLIDAKELKTIVGHCPNLVRLGVYGSGLSRSDIERLATLKRLDSLLLSGEISDDALTAIEKSTQISELTIYIDSSVGEGLKGLSKLKNLRVATLKLVDRSQDKPNGPCRQVIEELKKMTHMKSLVINASNREVEELHDALPNCRVISW